MFIMFTQLEDFLVFVYDFNTCCSIILKIKVTYKSVRVRTHTISKLRAFISAFNYLVAPNPTLPT